MEREKRRPKKWYCVSRVIESVKLRPKTKSRLVCEGFHMRGIVFTVLGNNGGHRPWPVRVRSNAQKGVHVYSCKLLKGTECIVWAQVKLRDEISHQYNWIPSSKGKFLSQHNSDLQYNGKSRSQSFQWNLPVASSTLPSPEAQPAPRVHSSLRILETRGGYLIRNTPDIQKNHTILSQ